MKVEKYCPPDSSTDRRRLLLFVPLGTLLVIAVLLYYGFTLNDPHLLPSALLGKQLPEFSLATLDDPAKKITNKDLKGRVVLINVWATWCPTCAAEHAQLLKIRHQTGLPIIGVVYKDDSAKARSWLARRGNPYEVNALDQDGRLGVNLGVYGAPESYLIDPDGIIVYKRVGEINERVWRSEIQPQLKKLGFPLTEIVTTDDAQPKDANVQH